MSRAPITLSLEGLTLDKLHDAAVAALSRLSTEIGALRASHEAKQEGIVLAAQKLKKKHQEWEGDTDNDRQKHQAETRMRRLLLREHESTKVEEELREERDAAVSKLRKEESQAAEKEKKIREEGEEYRQQILSLKKDKTTLEERVETEAHHQDVLEKENEELQLLASGVEKRNEELEVAALKKRVAHWDEMKLMRDEVEEAKES